MAHLWVSCKNGDPAVLVLEKPEHELPAGPDSPAPATLVRLDSADAWVVVIDRGTRVHINGVTTVADLVVLADRDEIRLAGAPPVWFSTETIARVEEAPSLDVSARCPRCREPIKAGSPAVLCPGCRVWQHQSDLRPCFTYEGAPCTACGEKFALDGGFRWQPEAM